MEQRLKVLADGWYSWVIPSFRPLTDLTERWPGPLRGYILRCGPLRALMLLVASSRYDRVAVTRTDTGWRSLLVLRALCGRRRKLMVLHFIDHPQRTAGRGRIVDRAWRPIERWATRRAVRSGQVLSPWERDLYAKAFGVQRERFQFIPFAWRMGNSGGQPDQEHELVIAVGRAFCDWPTLFAAARRGRWPLLVVCGANDFDLVQQLNADGRATVMCEIPHERARELMRGAAVCVLPMREVPISHGQVRVCDAVDAGAAVVASRVRSLEGYVEDGLSAVLVPPGDPDRLAEAIERLLADPQARERLASTAFERASAWTWIDYTRAIETFVHGGTPTPPPGATAS